MSDDKKTTIVGTLGGLASILSWFDVIIPEQAFGAILGITVAILGYFIGKKQPA